MLDSSFVLLVDGLHYQTHEQRTFTAEFGQIDFHCIVRTVYRFAIVNEVVHLDIQQQWFVCILHIECIEVPALRNDGHICLALEILDRSLYSDDILGTVSLACNQIGRTQINISHRRREDNMHGLVVCNLQPVRRNHPVKGEFSCQTIIEVAILFHLRIHLLRKCYGFHLLIGYICYYFLCIGTYYARYKGKHQKHLFHFLWI